jgi:lactate dehydrogenase-like 2-hydroxyacid dehydrogenase
MAQIFVTRRISEEGTKLLEAAGHIVDVSQKDGVLTKEELISALSAKPYDAVISLLTDHIDAEVLAAAKIFANYAVGVDNIDLAAAKARGVLVTNTPDVLTDTVAEHAVALMASLTSRIVEGDKFMRAGKYVGWDPMLLLGTDLKGKTLGIIGAGRIGSVFAKIAHQGFGMNVIYTNPSRNEALEKEQGAQYFATADELLPYADVVSIHVPLLPTTQHLMNAERIAKMKPTAYLINTSRGPVVDEVALVEALQKNVIAGAGLDVFEQEPVLTPGLADLENVVLTPHLASGSRETRAAMAEVAARNVLAVLSAQTPPNTVG